MDGTAVAKIVELTKLAMEPCTAEFGELVHPDLKVHLPAAPEPVRVSTLRSLAALGKTILAEDAETEGLVLHVEGPQSVRLLDAQLDEWARRRWYGSASFDPYQDDQGGIGNPFRGFVRHEDALIFLRANCADTDHLAYVIRILAGISDDHSVEHADDGLAQKATVRAGIAHFEVEDVKAVVRLAPYRTFPEITPPVSDFVFRLQKGPHGPMARLIPADGERWALEAVERIAAYLGGEISIPVLY